MGPGRPRHSCILWIGMATLLVAGPGGALAATPGEATDLEVTHALRLLQERFHLTIPFECD